MVSRPRGSSAVPPMLLLLAGMASLSGFASVTLTSENLYSELWPADIQQAVCDLFGSTVTWTSVLLRLSVFIVVLLFVSRMVQDRESTLRLAGQLGKGWLLSLVWLVLWLAYPFVASGFLLTLLELTSPFWVAVFAAVTLNAVLEVLSHSLRTRKRTHRLRSEGRGGVCCGSRSCWDWQY